jgi:ribosomal-protein-alanine N-acetyltransferase
MGEADAEELTLHPFRPPPLRPLVADDWALALALDGRSLGGFWSEALWRGELGRPGALAYGHDGGGVLLSIACGWVVVDELHITVLATAPDWRRRGLGRALLQALAAAAFSRGCTRATLEVASGNQAALALYASAGFRTAGCRRGYYTNGDDALIQWRSLRGAGDGLCPAAV